MELSTKSPTGRLGRRRATTTSWVKDDNTTIDYGPYAQYGLPYLVTESGVVNGNMIDLRRSFTDYQLTQPYLDRRIVGLVSTVRTYDPGTSQWQSKVTYDYDAPANIQPQAVTAVQHDQSFDDANLVRGNVTSVSRWDTNDINNAGKKLTTQVSYNAAGSVLNTSDPLGHGASVNYTDQFAANGTTLDASRPATWAYPTSVSDADGYTSRLRYHYDFGAVTWKQTPQPSSIQNLPGPEQTFEYDAAGRIQRVTNLVNNAYTRYVYGPTYMQSWSSVNNVADEAYTVEIFDAAGRVVAAASQNPGSTGGFKAQLTQYDRMGRMMKQSNPTEMNGWWNPAGDDAAGWIYTTQTYDWKGRPLETTNQDGHLKYASYSACGCAGSEVVTLTDEVGRQQKVYSDVLGRTAKTEILSGNEVYSTTVNTFNARDQVTLVRQYQGGDTSGVYQDTTMSYDGYGRLHTKHVPEQEVNTATTWDYNIDDTVNTVTDARGATATFGYNNRHQVTSATHTLSGQSTIALSYGYDAAGNRTSMTDPLGNKSYSYNQLSQLMSETRTFDVGTFTLNYDYNLAGELTKITDPTNMTINYAYDNAGKLNGVTGSDNLFAGVSNYASNFQYRAWGGLKTSTDGSDRTSSLLYNSKLQPTHFDISGSVVSQNYDYYNDGRISYVHNTTDGTFDRSYFYDHVGRLVENRVGGYARGDFVQMPYYETFGYDALSNLTARDTDTWNLQAHYSDTAGYGNNRRSGWGYDADGRNTTIDTRTNTFDAVGQQIQMSAPQQIWNGSYITLTQANNYDGDGAMVKEVDSQSNAPGSAVTTYYLRSSVLGGAIIEELNSSGQKMVGYVYDPGGSPLATQSGTTVTWKHTTPAGTSRYDTYSAYSSFNRTEFDPLGADVSLTAPPDPPPAENPGDVGAGHFAGIMDARYADMFNISGGCRVDGMAASCSMAMAQLNMGASKLLPAGVLTIQVHWDFTNGDLLINGTNYAIGDNGSVSTRKWVDGGKRLDKQHDNPNDDVIRTYTDETAGHWDYSLINTGFAVPQNPALDIDRTWSREFDCNRSASDLFRTLRSEFSKFASFAGPIAGGLGTAGIHFDKGPIIQRRTIDITTGVISNETVPGTSILPSQARQISVTVQNVSTTSFTFQTNPGHVLYPGTISFSASDAGVGRVAASVTAKGNFADLKSQGFFEYLGGKEFENSVWKNFLDNLQRSCGSLK